MINKIMCIIIPDGFFKGVGVYNKFVRTIFGRILPAYFYLTKTKPLKPTYTKVDIVVSLTSFGERVNKLDLCLHSLFRQSLSPQKIVLWLSDKEYSIDTIPDSLKNFIPLGLDIRFCEDLRSHKKYYYSMKLWPESVIVTVDDDVYYPENMLSDLVASYERNPSCISCHRAHLVSRDKNNILPYLKWGFASPGKTGPSHDLMAVGVGGVLYPPGVLHKDVFDKEILEELCFYADDIWLKIMAYRFGSKIVKVRPFSKTLISTSNNEGFTLSEENVLGGKNDIQLNDVLNHYNINNGKFLNDKL